MCTEHGLLEFERIICDIICNFYPKFLRSTFHSVHLHLQPTQYICIPETTGEEEGYVSFTFSLPSVSQQGFQPIHIFITQVKANCNTGHTVAFSTHSEPRGVILYVSSFPANVQLLLSAFPGVLHDCSFKRSYLILYITLGAKGHSSHQRGAVSKQDGEKLWRSRGEKFICFFPNSCMTAPTGRKCFLFPI